MSQRSKVRFSVPDGACDCHVHVFLDSAHYPLTPGRAYTPPEASVETLQGLHRDLGLSRTVIVQPSVYGSDNSATLEGIRQLGMERARGVAVLDDRMGPADLDRLAQAGVRGVRVNLEMMGEVDPGRSARLLKETAARVAPHGWHIQIFSNLALISALAPVLLDLRIPVVIDHFGGAKAAAGLDQAGFGQLLSLIRSGHVWIKLSAAYRCSTLVPDYPDMMPLARALIAAGPERTVWGSDWPHPNNAKEPGRGPTDIAPPLPIDDGRVLSLLADWADAETRRRILVDNPSRLYGF
ncbi:MAG TPA: amidohydrolase family protein [Alphaproteobacteria bacterium]|nr:amidohydrolase family protein [Alphaproteobacteria bacterium]